MAKPSLTTQARNIARNSRDSRLIPAGWRHDGWLDWYHVDGSTFFGAQNQLMRYSREKQAWYKCYAYDIHEAAAILATGIRRLPAA